MSVIRKLKVRLTDVEWGAAAKQLGSVQADLNDMKQAQAQYVAEFKVAYQGLNEKFAQLGECVRSGEETRTVECMERGDAKRLVIELYRVDTGELVETRPMTSQEREDALQVTLPGMQS
jgi:hypothetical protein